MSTATRGISKGSLYSGSARLIYERHRSMFWQAILIFGLAIGLLFWLRSRKLDKIEAVTINWPFISAAIKDHLILSFLSAIIILAVAIPAGIALPAGTFTLIDESDGEGIVFAIDGEQELPIPISTVILVIEPPTPVNGIQTE